MMIVITQLENIYAIKAHLNLKKGTSIKLIPIIAPVMHCVVEIGIPYAEAIVITQAAEISAQNPRDGEMNVRSEPSNSMIFRPYVASPIHIPPALMAIIQRGHSDLLETLPLS